MPAQPKPDSSYASNRLTRNNRPARHLLSTYNKPSEEPKVKLGLEPGPESKEPDTNEEHHSESDNELSSLSSNAIDELQDDADVRPKRDPNEPATDDDPLSSSGESSDDDAPQSPAEEKKQTLVEKLAEDDLKMPSSPASGPSGSHGAQNPSVSGRKGGLIRTSSNVFDKDSNDELFISWSQKPSKRAKASISYSKNNSFSGAPSSSARSAATPDKRSQETKSSTRNGKVKKTKGSSEEPEPHMGFKVPMEIDIPSPRKPSPGFKVPPEIPIDSTSSSSLATLSSKCAQPTSLDDDSPISSLSSPASSLASSDAPPPKSLCPWCKKEVDPALLILFEAQPKQRLREQQQFCASHQQNAAEREWETQGYPEIDWDKFDERVQKHFTHLERLLVPDCLSYYRNILDTNLKEGKAKNFRLTLAGDGLETISCGYYGTKGAAKMLQAIVDRFSLRLRRLATTDEIVKKAGVAGYAQSVLVPELAVRLVKEDMGVDDDSARQILRDSIEIGQRLNPALDDVVPIPEEIEDCAQE